MRIIADISSNHLATKIDQTQSDRVILLSHFIPLRSPSTSHYAAVTDKQSLHWMKMMFASLFNMKYQPAGKDRLQWGGDLVDLLKPRKPVNSYTAGETAIVAKFVKEIDKAGTLEELVSTYNAFQASPEYVKIESKAFSNSGQFHSKIILAKTVKAVAMRPVGVADQTSELGYLFLDQTRISPVGFTLGEHIFGLSLAPGEEVVLEQKSTMKETRTFEETLEREFEEKFLTSTEVTRREQTQANTDRDQQTNTNVGGNLGVGGSVPIKGATVNADAGVDGSASFANAVSTSDQLSQETAVRHTTTVENRLKSAHKTKFTISKEVSFEERSTRTIKNPNETTSLTLHYFKILQKLQLQQERSGVRLCWAPFVADPGASLRLRMEEARHNVIQQYRNRLDIPPQPLPPTKEYVREWVKGPAEPIFTSPPLGFSNMLDWQRLLTTSIPDQSIYTGRLKVELTGETALGSHAVVLTPPSEAGPANGKIEALVSVKPAWNLVPTVLYAALLAEVQRVPPSYDAQHEQYLQRLDRWNSEVAEMLTRAEIEAAPQAEAAALSVLGQADLRTEMLQLVIKQRIAPVDRNTGFEVELWHRLLDFDNVSFILYPGWWNDSPAPYPELGSAHLLNASWARVFIPIKHRFGAPDGKSNEEKFLKLLYKPGAGGSISVNAFNQFATKIAKDLLAEQAKYYDSRKVPIVQKIGNEWTVAIPTDGTHVECVQGATTAADPLTERRVEANVHSREVENASVAAETAVMARVVDPVEGKVAIGKE